MHEFRAVVLRTPSSEGDYMFRFANLPLAKAEQWEQRASAGSPVFGDASELNIFGPPMDLAAAMELLDSRDFQVLDLPQCLQHC